MFDGTKPPRANEILLSIGDIELRQFNLNQVRSTPTIPLRSLTQRMPGHCATTIRSSLSGPKGLAESGEGPPTAATCLIEIVRSFVNGERNAVNAKSVTAFDTGQPDLNHAFESA